MPTPPDTFGQKAAKFSLYAPICALLVGLINSTLNHDLTTTNIIACLDMLLILSGFVSGIVALSVMHRYGRAGILGRSIVGLTINTALLTVGVLGLIPVITAARLKPQLVGHWQTHDDAQGNAEQIDFQNDGTCIFQTTARNTITTSASGPWVLTPRRLIALKIDHILVGDASAVGKSLAIGTIKSFDGTHLTLHTDSGDETLTRE